MHRALFLLIPLIFSNAQINDLIEGLEVLCNSLIVYENTAINIIAGDKGHESKDFVEAFLTRSSLEANFSLTFETAEEITKVVKIHPRKFTVLVVTKCEQIKIIFGNLTNENFLAHGHLIITLTTTREAKNCDFFSEFWKRDFYNVIVVYKDSDGYVPVLTFMPYRSKNCGNTTPITVSRFANGSFTNDLTTIFSNKLRNMQQCDVRISTLKYWPPHIYTEVLSNGTQVIRGRDYELLLALAKGLNFTLNFSYIGEMGYLLENGSATGSLESVLKNESDIVIGDWFLKVYRLKFLDATISYISEQVIFVVPQANELSSIEKLIYPLTLSSWIILVILISCGLIVIFFATQVFPSIKNLIFGENVSNPCVNFITGFLGLSQNQLPKRNFARFLLMNFLLFSLVIRTVYQGKMFKLLRTNMRNSEPNNINEIIEKGYELFIPDNAESLVSSKFKYKLW